MKKLKKQINESFFNPVLHFLPLIVFMVVDDYWGLRAAWFSSLPVVIILFVYVLLAYKKILEWYLFSTLIYLVVAILASVLPYNKLVPEIRFVSLEFILLSVFAVSLLLRKKVESFINNRNKKMLSMVNNLNELFRMIWILGVVIFFFVHIYTFAILFEVSNLLDTLNSIHNAYLFVIFCVLMYELIRVTIIRVRLLREEWWPIVNEQGKMIGSIQHQASLLDENKFMHPVVRVMLVDNNRILLQKRCKIDNFSPGLWDTAISNHVKLSENIEQCIQRTAYERYGLDDIKSVFLSNYIHETAHEFHYAFLFVACRLPYNTINSKFIDQAKWWTLGQIEENLSSGIFTENFVSELDLLKRSGLLDSVQCECDCKLKEVIYNGTKNEN